MWWQYGLLISPAAHELNNIMLSVRWGPIQTFLMVNLQPALNNCPLVARTVFQLEIGQDCSHFALFQKKRGTKGCAKDSGVKCPY